MANLGNGWLSNIAISQTYGTNYTIKYYNYGAGWLSNIAISQTYGTNYTIKYYNYGTAYVYIFPLVPAGNDPTRYGRG